MFHYPRNSSTEKGSHCYLPDTCDLLTRLPVPEGRLAFRELTSGIFRKSLFEEKYTEKKISVIFENDLLLRILCILEISIFTIIHREYSNNNPLDNKLLTILPVLEI